MHPRLPHGQRRPPILTTTWPISPAPPRPRQDLPSKTIPPPTPVPQKTPSTDRYGRPAPSRYSASVATWTSLPTRTRVPSSSASVGPSAKLPPQPGRLLALDTVPVAVSTVPGEPTPTPDSAEGSVPAIFVASVMAAAISCATSDGVPLVGVGRRHEPRSRCRPSTTTASIFVPPRSIPPRNPRRRSFEPSVDGGGLALGHTRGIGSQTRSHDAGARTAFRSSSADSRTARASARRSRPRARRA